MARRLQKLVTMEEDRNHAELSTQARQKERIFLFFQAISREFLVSFRSNRIKKELTYLKEENQQLFHPYLALLYLA